MKKYANINGILLSRSNYKEGDKEHFTFDEASRLNVPSQKQWEHMLELDYTWDDDKKGIWIGRGHEKKQESDICTFLPADGYRHYNGSLCTSGYNGYYWSSTPFTPDTALAYTFNFNSGGVASNSNSCRHGFAVRCLSNEHKKEKTTLKSVLKACVRWVWEFLTK
ncbi:MAG: DUF1566 domain-containing protein [Bacillus cereus]|jgi:hypothetical protein|nr:DUF1566 domain-containing protein [Bacillus cereus]